MKNTRSYLFALFLAVSSQCSGLAHAPVALRIPLHHATNSSLHQSTKNILANFPVSGSSRAFATSIKTLSGATIKYTILNAPLNNISGQFNGALYGKASDGAAGYFGAFPAFLPFGNNPANGGTFLSNSVFNNLSNSISTG